jgi:DNA-binding CsgD family transcriptional regulator
MDQDQRLSQLIGGIYDAALDPSRWRGVLGETTVFVKGAASALFAKDATAKTGTVYYDDDGIDPAYTQLYFDKYIKFDPATTAQFFAEIEEPFATADLMPYEEFLESRFYLEWAKPLGLVDFVSAVLDKSVTSMAMFGVFRHARDGIVDDATRHRVRLVVPHIRRAVLIANAIELKTATAESLADTLDGISAGMFLVDAQGRIVHANANAHAMLADGAVLTAPGGKLVAGDAATDAALHEALLETTGSRSTPGIKGIAIPLTTRRGDRYVAHVLPLTSGARQNAERTYRATAAVFVQKATLYMPAPPEIIAKSYRLTPTELRVLLAIVQVGGAPEVAIALGIAETTVKTHLGGLYDKTGARRHADLVKLVAGFSNPLLK